MDGFLIWAVIFLSLQCLNFWLEKKLANKALERVSCETFAIKHELKDFDKILKISKSNAMEFGYRAGMEEMLSLVNKYLADNQTGIVLSYENQKNYH